MKRRSFRLAGIVTAGLLGWTAGARAVDGVIEINDASILAGGGYPAVIGAPGSYVLTGNLTPPPGADGINVFAPDVTIDLNGFRIDGAGVAADCIDSGFGFPGLTVRNGFVTGCLTGIAGGTGSKIFQVTATGNLFGGIIGFECLIVESTVTGNGVGVQAERCKVENNIIRNNGGIGLFGPNNVIVHNNIVGNGGGGIATFDGSTIQENVISMNAGFGVSDTLIGPLPPPPPVPIPVRINLRGNIIDGNGGPAGGPGVSFVTPSLISDNTVSSNTGSGIVCGAACVVNGNVIDSNNTLFLAASGGAIVGAGSNVTDNSISFNSGFGLNLPATAGYSQNTLNANLGLDVLAIPPGPHPTSGFMNLCTGIPGPAPTCP
jgi:hypothetical protein